MTLINATAPEDLNESARELCASFLEKTGMLPAPLVLMSSSPDFFEAQCRVLNRFRAHPSLSMEVLACIRYLVSVEHAFEACVEFNGGLLRFLGKSDEELSAMVADAASAPLADKDRALLVFVMKSLRRPDEVGPEELASLRAHGFSDGDVVEACFHGADLEGKAKLVRAFQVESLRAGSGAGSA